jgi:hypothetical protein
MWGLLHGSSRRNKRLRKGGLFCCSFRLDAGDMAGCEVLCRA